MIGRWGGWWVLVGLVLIGCGAGSSRSDGPDGSDTGDGSGLTRWIAGRRYRVGVDALGLASAGYLGKGENTETETSDGGMDVTADVANDCTSSDASDGSGGVGGGSGGAAGFDGGAGGSADAVDVPADAATEVFPDATLEVAADDMGLIDASAPIDTPAPIDANDEPAATDVSDAGTETDPADVGVEQPNAGSSDGEVAPETSQADSPPEAPPPLPGPPSVGITWASIANVYLELGPALMLIDGYITRLPGNDFFGGGSGLAFTHTNYSSDEAAIRGVLTALGGPGRINWLFTGHSHWDHSFDTATWARLTGAPIYGPSTTCLQARAEGTPVAGCTAVVGGEKIPLAPGVTVRVIRWNHSGDSTSNPEQHNPVELKAVPTPDAQGRLRAGVSEDFPNGGGSRAFLFTIDSSAGMYSVLFEDSSSAADLKQPIILDGVNYGAPLSNLAAAMADSSLTHVDLWIATGGAPVAQLVVPVINPKAYLPVHWDGLFRAFKDGAPVFDDKDLTSYLKTQGVKLVTPVQYMDKWSVSPSGIVPVDNKQVQRALGF